MQEKLQVLEKLNLGDFVRINDTTFKSESGDLTILNRLELNTLLRQRLIEEVPYVENEFLKPYLPDNFQSDVIISDLKELSKFDPTILFNSIIDQDLFLLELTSLKSSEISELILSNSQMVYSDETYTVFYTEIEK